MGWDDGLPDARPRIRCGSTASGSARTPVTNAEFGAFLAGQRRAAPAVLGRSAILGSRAAGRGRDVGRGRRASASGSPRETRPPPPPPDRGGVGARGAGRPGGRALSVGRRAAGPLVRRPGGPAARAAARGTGAGQRLRADRSRRRRPRVVLDWYAADAYGPEPVARPDGSAGRARAACRAAAPGATRSRGARWPTARACRLTSATRTTASGWRAGSRQPDTIADHGRASPRPPPDRRPADHNPPIGPRSAGASPVSPREP